MADLVSLADLSPTRLSVFLGLAVTAAVLWGFVMLGIERHFAAVRDAGEGLSGMGTVLAAGAAPVTIAPGWIAAGFFGLAVARLRLGAPEPPITRTDPVDLTATDMRAGLRREYRVVGMTLLGLAAIALLDVGRLAVVTGAAIAGDSVVRPTVPMIAAEVTGLLAATVVLGLWASAFRSQLERLGALSERGAG